MMNNKHELHNIYISIILFQELVIIFLSFGVYSLNFLIIGCLILFILYLIKKNYTLNTVLYDIRIRLKKILIKRKAQNL